MDAIIGLERAIDYIEENLMEPLDVKDIAKRAYLSEYHFQRVFSMALGCAVGEYIRNRRLSVAGAQVTGTKRTLIDIALESGYDTPEGFARAFKRAYGQSPMEARRKKAKLAPYDRIRVSDKFKGDGYGMEKLTARGYTVEENGALYYTLHMDEAAKWFENVLGWYACVEARNGAGEGTYGCATPVPGELINLGVAAFHGFHLFYGAPREGRVGFVLVRGIAALRAHVLKMGWTKIGEIREEPWNASAVDVTTPEGSVITFFETH